MKSVFIASPQWLPVNPPFSLVPIVSYLKSQGRSAEIIDLNIDFYLYILNENYLKKTLLDAEKQLPALYSFISKHIKPGASQNSYDNDFKAKLLRYNKIKETAGAKKQQALDAAAKVQHSIDVMRDENLFYNLSELTSAMQNIDFCLEIASLLWFPAKIQMGNYYDPFFKLDLSDMIKAAKTKNIFTEFLDASIPSILNLNPDIIGLSINSGTQIVSALTLAVKLKAKSKAKIMIGGNFFSRVTDTIMKYPEFFYNFCDYLTAGEGEIPNLKLMEHLEGKIGIDEVPNTLYVKNGKVVQNPMCSPLPLEEMPVSDLSSFDLKKYFTPAIVLPQNSSRGCYWGKCSFCDHDFGQHVNIKSVSKFAGELEYLNKTYGIKYFELIDECISPAYLDKLANEILSRKLDIYWFNNARIENAFTDEILSNAHNAGLKMLLWGFESGSKRIMQLINKGIDIDMRSEILRRSRKAGIWNFAFIFFGFPSETNEDAQETIDYIKNNTDIISSYGRSIFSMGKHAPLRENPQKYSITKIFPDKEEFSPSWHFETSLGMNDKEISAAAERCTKECSEAYKNPVWMYLIQREILFLYICRFGADKLEAYSVI